MTHNVRALPEATASGHRCRSGMRCGLLEVWLSTLLNVLSTLLHVL